jgi:2-succinyl-5-enolpyruvyl-6-hydroxy-3-cyclohexene-1-carboxylate synthase
MTFDAPNLNHLWARLLVEELLRVGVSHFCVSPGSRSTPLAHAVAARAGEACTVHFDERGAAFHALGWARATGRPAALVCTSGSAVANYWPAVVEAHAARVPLIVITADRPPELLDCGANQAIDQRKIFGDYVRWAAELPCPSLAMSPSLVLTTADQAVHRASTAPAGPVHVNCMFREPLAPVPSNDDLAGHLAPLQNWLQSGAPHTTYHAPGAGAGTALPPRFLADLDAAKRGLLVVGQLTSQEETTAVRSLAKILGWPVFADVTSGLRLGEAEAPFVPYYDQLLLSGEFRHTFRPDFVLHLGGSVTSKRLNEHLTELRPAYTVVSDHPARQDPGHLVRHRIDMNLAAFCNALAKQRNASPLPDATAALAASSQQLSTAIDTWLAAAPVLTEMHVARCISRMRPAGSTLFLGNSMPIRDMDLYGAAEGPAGPVAANRGASGIDGNIACAAGHAAATGRPTTAILGDLATLHDLNSLALLRGLRAPLILVVINNDGGGIFHFLPVSGHGDHFERFFGTPHGMSFESAAAQFGLRYEQPANVAALAAVYGAAIERDTPALIEVRTAREENVQQHRALQEVLRGAMAETIWNLS